MIYGVGTDVVEVSRIAKALERFGDDFAKKILSHEEFLVFQKNNLKIKKEEDFIKCISKLNEN